MLLLPGLLAGIAAARCFEPSPSFPPPNLRPDDPVLAQTFDFIHYKLRDAVNEPRHENVSFAVEVTSSKGTLWWATHTSRLNARAERSVSSVDDKTLFRIASITKTFTVLGILYQHAAGNISLDDSVLKYLPDLKRSASSHLAWKDMTIRVLASQLGGIFRDVTFEDAINDPSLAAMLGLPTDVSTSGLPTCGEFNGKRPCNASDMFGGFVGRSGLYAPNQKSTYSNDAFSILGLVLANVTGTSYSAYIESAIFKPLGMNLTTLEPPSPSVGIVPAGETQYGVEEGVNRPTGGIYSCIRDMSTYLRYVLTHYNGLTHGAVNWFHPQSYAEGSQSFYGMPWEILRTNDILPGTQRPVTFVTKAGLIGLYRSRIVMSAEHDIGVTILVAGDYNNFVVEAQEIVTVPLIRAVDKLAMAQMSKYEGTYIPVSESGNRPLNTTLTLRTVEHSGLRVVEFISNGTDVLTGITQAMEMDLSTHWHLTPTLLYRDFDKQAGELWRMVPVGNVDDFTTAQIWDSHCYTNVEMVDYAGVPFNEFVFWYDSHGRLDELELSGYRIKLSKVKRHHSATPVLWKGDAELRSLNDEL